MIRAKRPLAGIIGFMDRNTKDVAQQNSHFHHYFHSGELNPLVSGQSTKSSLSESQVRNEAALQWSKDDLGSDGQGSPVWDVCGERFVTDPEGPR